MFTAWGSQTPFCQIGHKGTTKNAHTQTKLQKVYFRYTFVCFLRVDYYVKLSKTIIKNNVNYCVSRKKCVTLRPI